MDVYLVIVEPRNDNEDFEGNDYEVIGIFSTKELAKKAIKEDIKEWNEHCNISENNYTIEKIVMDQKK